MPTIVIICDTIIITFCDGDKYIANTVNITAIVPNILIIKFLLITIYFILRKIYFL